jgi:hypothetical protein
MCAGRRRIWNKEEEEEEQEVGGVASSPSPAHSALLQTFSTEIGFHLEVYSTLQLQ